MSNRWSGVGVGAPLYGGLGWNQGVGANLRPWGPGLNLLPAPKKL